MAVNVNTENIVYEHTYRIDCPFGGAAQIVVRKMGNGINEGKCELAERLWLAWNGASLFLKLGQNGIFTDEMRKQGCPHPPYFSLLGGWRSRCKYNLGNWVAM